MMSLKQKSRSRLITVTVILLGCLCVPAVGDESVRIMPLGDSITHGLGSPNYNGYRKPLYLSLTAADYNFDFVGSMANGVFPDVNHEGHSGWHADGCPLPYQFGDVLDNVYNWLTANPADIVLLHIGTNDISYDGQDANEVSDILDEIDRYSPDVKVILALIVNRREDASDSLQQATTQFNQDVNEMAQSRISTGDDIVIVNMESALDYNVTGGDMDSLLHPNNSGYAKMADVWFDALDSIINPPLITSEPITSATVSQLYSYDVNVDANCYPEPTYTLTECPNGMTIDYNTGLIEWIPAAVGDFNVTVEVNNGQPPDANQSFVITVDRRIKFDAASSNFSSSNGNMLSWQHTIGDSNNRILIVGIAGEDDTVDDLVISSVKYNDVNMALVEGSSVTVGSGTYMKTELYYLLDADLPLLAGDYNVVVTYNGSVINRCGGAISLANVAQQGREAVATNSNVNQDTISTNITTLTDNAWVVDVVGCGNDGSFLTNDSNMTERFDITADSSTAAGSTRPVELAQETTMSWTHSGANQLAHSVAAFAPVPYIIAGYVISEPNNMPVEGVLVSTDANGGYDTNGITDANGYYEVNVPPGWSGAVMPIKDEQLLFAPSERVYSNVATNLSGQDYIDIGIYDIDGSGFIDWEDVEVICDNWLVVGPNVPGDIYKDEETIVNFLDFAEFAQVW